MMNLLYQLIKIALLLLLPFAILIRSATYFHVHYEWPAMLCLMGSATATAILMFIYFSFFYGKFTGSIGNFGAVKRRALIAFLVVVVYSMHGILFFSSDNLKSSALKNEMNSLHPILRLSLSTLVYANKDLLITDASRVPEDYKKMGLPSNSTSLHYKQPTSKFAHAVDLRTKGKSEWVNALVKGYFSLMGFNTIRHGGTADHLHVSLKSHDYPHAK